MTVKSALLKRLIERGFVHQCTDDNGLGEHLIRHDSAPIYIGFDCTAPTLHVGSLLQIMVLRHVQKLGYKPIILLGGATTKIGDPSGKDETRTLKTDDIIAKNKEGIATLMEQFLSFGRRKNDAMIIDNDEWLADKGYIDFLREVGPHFSVNRMLTFESVKRRLDREQTLSFLEFNYMILQAYDFVVLNERYDCQVQIGGSDQWGNIVNGIELNRRLGRDEIFGLTTHLITTSSGEKMGKTASGAVWLTDKDLSSYDYWQFWRNTEDGDVGRFLRLFTELPLEEIEELEAYQGAQINEAKIILANEATSICHGTEAAQAAHQTANQTFAQGGVGDDLPICHVAEDELTSGFSLYKLVLMAELAESGGAARRLIKGGGVKINDEKQSDPECFITMDDYREELGYIKLSAGKKRHVLVKLI